ncbi:hypothetical protein BCU13_022655 [Vibrio lentus]|uniref:hypothetical protein n=1 Tax=Vibrio lentus TaxID=136468 RepID=UPI0039A4DF0A
MKRFRVFRAPLHPTLQRFRIYRETLSRFSCAASTLSLRLRVFAFIVKRFRVFRAPLQFGNFLRVFAFIVKRFRVFRAPLQRV